MPPTGAVIGGHLIKGRIAPTVLLLRWAVCGTDIGYAASRRSLYYSRNPPRRATRFPIVLCTRYALSGAELYRPLDTRTVCAKSKADTLTFHPLCTTAAVFSI
eukprot:1664098-Rhodomonas_salina.1